MGQLTSNPKSQNPVPSSLEGVVPPEDSLRLMQRLQSYRKLVFLSYEEFVGCVQDLNALSRNYVDPNGKQLLFAVKKGTDTTVLWRATVHVACVKKDAQSGVVESVRLLNLRQFMQVFKTLQCQLGLYAIPHTSVPEEEQMAQGACAMVSPTHVRGHITTSMLLDGIPGDENSEECCICMDRTIDTTLPCTHAYCQPCIEKWNVEKKSCPICCEKIASTKDAWEMAEAPDEFEVQLEIQRALEDLLVPSEKESPSSPDTLTFPELSQ